MSARGVGRVELFEDNMDANKLKQILHNNLVQSAQTMYAENEHWWLLHDNDKKFTSRTVKEWLFNKGIQVMEMPPYSPDLNPIENLWSDLKRRVDARRAKDMETLKTVIKEEWECTNVNLCRTLAESMKKRCQRVINNNGNKTKY